MFEQYVTIFGRQWQVYTLALVCGVAVSLLWLVLRAPDGKRRAVLETLLVMALTGIFTGRLLHVAMHRAFFTDRPFLIANLSAEGGIAWQGVVIGGLFAGLVVMHWRGIDRDRFLDDLAPVLALLSFAAWRGCAASGCAAGKSVASLVDYPDWLIWLEKDIFRLIEPRFAVQQLGMWLAIMLLVLALLLSWRGMARGRQFWMVLLFLSSGMFLLGFLRGDEIVLLSGLRADQWLDAIVCGFAVIMGWRGRSAGVLTSYQ